VDNSISTFKFNLENEFSVAHLSVELRSALGPLVGWRHPPGRHAVGRCPRGLLTSPYSTPVLVGSHTAITDPRAHRSNCFPRRRPLPIAAALPSRRWFKELVTTCLSAALLSVTVLASGQHATPPLLHAASCLASRRRSLPRRCQRRRGHAGAPSTPAAKHPHRLRVPTPRRLEPRYCLGHARRERSAQRGPRPTSRFGQVWQWATHCCRRSRPSLC
jgi:hypothetical protein